MHGSYTGRKPSSSGIVTIPQLLGFRPVYEPCVRLCDGLGVPRSKVPHEAIIQHAP